MTGTRTATTVSVVYIVKNEEDVLAASLESVRWADQIVVYDTGSTDRTRDIARRFTDRVIEGYWDDDFAAARNRALAHATSEWVLVIDADEVLEGSPDTVRRGLGRGGATLHAVLVDNGAVRGHPLSAPSRASQYASPRIFLRSAYRYEGRVHEQPVLIDPSAAGPVTPIPDVVVRHGGYLAGTVDLAAKGARNLAIAQRNLTAGIEIGLPAPEIELRRIQVIRSRVLSGALREALDEADEMAVAGFVVHRNAVILATALVEVAEALDGPSAGERWLRVWEEHDLNPAAARLQRVKAAALRGDAAAALDAVESLPTTTTNSLGERIDRDEVVKTEVWALSRTGRVRRAEQVAARAAARGVAPGSPAGLAELLGAERCRIVIAALTDGLWREFVTACLMDPARPARQFLSWMHEVRPGDPTVLAAVAMATPTLSLEEAAAWSVAMRAVGAAEHCPLVGIAQDENLDPRQRAVAGALAYSAHDDERGLSGLEAALTLVPADQETELLAHLDVVAPGLVSPARSA